MTFPIITYKFNGLEEAKSLETIVDQKMAPLERLINETASTFCEVEFQKLTTQHNGRIFRVEANLSVDGVLYRAEATEENFESAIDEVRNELDKELSRAKDKHITLDRVAEREAKEQLQNN
ncbi:MAG: ribosome-associated translation inhibitor RaiA [Candidatus Pacebacteria bacterium]|nr:ribosome-associated translation inhibitor RaiA [Candidatus Paceibacterota bacterium]MBP9842596.1 ribosome-associated translation inhibitor RaiA [Candidatus Paceibacterota bacterium]